MSKKFDDILNECLDRAAKGEDVEQCLRDYPELASQLRPLLEPASKVQASSDAVQPRPQFRTAAKHQLLAQVRAKEQKQPKPGWFTFLEWQRRWAFAAVAVILVVILGGGTTVAASTNAMPDDFLYPVKLAVEDVRLTFAGSDVDKSELRAEFANRRVEEISQMADDGKWEEVEASAERLSDLLEKIADVATEKRAQGGIDEEDVAKLRRTLAHYATDHPLIFAKAIEQTPDEAKESIRNALNISESYYATAIQNVNIAVSSGEIQSVSPVHRTKIISGIIRMINDSKWVIGEEVVDVNDNTIITGSPKIGAGARIETQVQIDGSLMARKIEVKTVSFGISNVDTAVSPRPTAVETSKTSVPRTVETPTVVPVEIPFPDEIVETPSPTRSRKQFVDVFAVDDIEAPQTPEEVSDISAIRNFSGTIRRITDSEWTVGARTVIVDVNTVVRGDPTAGAAARIWVTVQPDGSLVARLIWVKNSSVQVPNTIVIETPQLTVEKPSVETNTGIDSSRP